MKVRTGFVSNSSSTSFAVVRNTENKYLDGKSLMGHIWGKGGMSEFGGYTYGPVWDLDSKFNWAFTLALISGRIHQDWTNLKTLLKIVRKETGSRKVRIWIPNENVPEWLAQELLRLLINEPNSFEWFTPLFEEVFKKNTIDHQAVTEENMEDLFSDPQDLRDFLFNTESRILENRDG